MRRTPPPVPAVTVGGSTSARAARIAAALLGGFGLGSAAAHAVAPPAAPAATVGRISDGRARAVGADAPPMDVRIEHCGPVLRSWWRNPDGALLAADELVLGADGGFVAYRYWLPGLAETMIARREGRVAHVELRQGGRRDERRVHVPPDVLVGPMLVPYAQVLAARGDGPRATVPYLVADRFLTIDFDLGVVPGTASPAVRIAASSVLVRPFVDPLLIDFDADGRFARLRGRALPATGTPGRKQPLVVDLAIESRHEAPCSPAPLARAPD